MDKGNISRIRDISSRSSRSEKREARKLIKKSGILNIGTVISTGNGSLHQVKSICSEYISFNARKEAKRVDIPLSKIERMIIYFIRYRVIDRSEVEAFFNFNSLMFGMLLYLFKNVSKMNKLGRVLRLIMKGLRVYYAGGDKSKSDLGLISRSGGNHVLFSYYWIRDSEAWKRYLKAYGLKCILDCGKFSEWAALQKGKQLKRALDIDEYIQFIRDNQEYIDGYFVFDEIGHYKKTKQNLEYMESCGLTPIPIYHKGSPYEELENLISKKYKVIGIGGTVNSKNTDQFLEYIFNRYPDVCYHGLGITKVEHILKYPFFSVDSSAWFRCRTKGIVLTESGQKAADNIPYEERISKSVSFLSQLEKPDVIEGMREKLNKYVQLSLFDTLGMAVCT